MILTALISGLFGIVRFIIGLFPDTDFSGVDFSGLFQVLSYAVWFLSPAVLVLLFSTIVFWLGFYLVSSVIKFIIWVCPFIG